MTTHPKCGACGKEYGVEAGRTGIRLCRRCGGPVSADGSPLPGDRPVPPALTWRGGLTPTGHAHADASSDPTVNQTTGQPCRGKLAARALAVMVLDARIASWLAESDPKALEQAKLALEPFGWPNREALASKLGVTS